MFNKAKKQAKAQAIAEAAEQAKKQASIPVITGTVPQDHTVIDSIFVLGGQKEGWLSGMDINKAFESVKSQMRKRCAELGGDVVVSCRFEHRIALDGNKQVLELFAYGTAVKLTGDGI